MLAFSMDVPRLNLRLAEQQAQGLYRRHRVVDGPQQVRLQVDGRTMVSFCSNDYLGLANHPDVKTAFIKGVQQYGVGSGAAHLITGHSRVHQQLEDELAEFTGHDRTLLFSTGYMAGVGVLSALAGRHDVIYQDKLNHASLLDGGLQSRAKMRRYPHADTKKLQCRLKNETAEHGLVVTDGVFSMEGDIAPLPDTASIASGRGYMTIVDDAHGFGVLGARGKGSVDAAGLNERHIPVYMATLGKAMGTFGAFVAGSREVIESLIQFARSYVYTTAPPPAIAEATRASLKILQQDEGRRLRLHDNIRYFRSAAMELGVDTGRFATAIQPVRMPDVNSAIGAQRIVERRGYLIMAIRPPTVPQPCLRITLCSEHTYSDIDGMLDELATALRSMGI